MAPWEQELATLAEHRGRALVGYAYVLCGDQRHAEDLVQDALVKVFSRLRRRDDAAGGVHPLGDGGTTEGYVRRTILTLYLDEYRRRRRWSGLKHLVAADDRSRGPESGATARADVAAALGRLAPRERACVVLRYFEDMTVPQIAEALGLAQGTVKRYLADATSTLRGLLQVSHETTGLPATGGPRETTDGRAAR
jgi:RNA polymerase sigma-70 factor (ECF subfamily)